MSFTLPTEAPFNETQRMWLKGFFAGLGLGNTPAAEAAPEVAGEPLAILWGSQTGTAEAFAKQLAKKAKAAGFSPSIHDMSSVEPSALVSMKSVAILTSTYGDGEPPDNAAALHSAIMAAEGNILEGVQFSVFALGDSNYPAFCQCGKDFDAKLETLGAKRLAPRVDGDSDFDAPFATWSESLLGSLVGETTAA
ncbi:MAG TPA: flavodoxin domain-containing protein [Luteolibacter sp.]